MSAVMEEKTYRGLREIAVLGFFAVACLSADPDRGVQSWPAVSGAVRARG